MKRGRRPKLTKIPSDLLQRYESGELNATKLAKLLGVSASPVLSVLHRLGMDTSKKHRRLLYFARTRGWRISPEEIHRQIVEAYRQGEGLTRVGKKFGFTAEGVRQVLLREGVRTRRLVRKKGVFRGATQLKAFAARLRTLRKDAGLTQGEVAAKAGLTGPTVSLIETGRRNPSWESVQKLANGLGASLSQLGVKAPRSQVS